MDQAYYHIMMLKEFQFWHGHNMGVLIYKNYEKEILKNVNK